MKLLLILPLVVLVSGGTFDDANHEEVNNYESDISVPESYNGESTSDKIIQKRSYGIGLWGSGGLGWPITSPGWGYGLSLGHGIGTGIGLGHGLTFGHGGWGGGWGGWGGLSGLGGLSGASLGWHGAWYPQVPSIYGSYGLSGWHHRR